MNETLTILKEQLKNLGTMFRLARFEEKASYQSHYLGMLWQILNPTIQIGIYYLIFGLGVNGGRTIKGIPFIVWMLIGIVAWFFISSSILGMSNSVYRKIGLVSKMKFPMSVLPSINIVSNLSTYFPMMGILIVTLFVFNIWPTIYWIQYLYYFLSMVIFLYSCGILFSTITIIIRDFHIILQSVIRLLFYVSGPIWDIENRNLPDWFIKICKLNPIYYLIEGFRDTFLSRQWFWENGSYAVVFWCFTLSMLLIGAHFHLRFRAKFIDFI